jgi:hypothetical protein
LPLSLLRLLALAQASWPARPCRLLRLRLVQALSSSSLPFRELPWPLRLLVRLLPLSPFRPLLALLQVAVRELPCRPLRALLRLRLEVQSLSVSLCPLRVLPRPCVAGRSSSSLRLWALLREVPLRPLVALLAVLVRVELLSSPAWSRSIDAPGSLVQETALIRRVRN